MQASTTQIEPVQKEVEASNYEPQGLSNTSKVEESIPKKTENIRGVSGLSLSSVGMKKRFQKKETSLQKDEVLPENPFSEADLVAHWKTYAKAKMEQGAHNIAAVLAMDTPKLKPNQTLVFEVANALNRVELTQEMASLMPYLRDKLKNHNIQLDIHISKTVVQETVYTPREKYELLLKINPELEKLRKTFDLDF